MTSSGTEIEESRAEVRIEPDLWEETLVLRTPLYEERLRSIDEATRALAALGPLPVLPRTRLPRDAILRLHVRLAVHPLAPAAAARVRSLYGGPPEDDEAGRREVSVGVGSILRFFLGRDADEDWVAEASSKSFRVPELEEEP
jgi:hypothetical protein